MQLNTFAKINLTLVLVVFLAVLCLTGFPAKAENEKSVTHKILEKRGKPQAPISVLSPHIIQVPEYKESSTEIVLQADQASLLIDTITLDPSSGLLVSPTLPLQFNVNASRFALPVKLLAMPKGRYYLHVRALLKPNAQGQGLNFPVKSFAIIVQVGAVAESELKLQKMSLGENLEILPAQEN